MARTGRRPGVSGTREAILDAARQVFSEQGYQHATIRGVADLAGVDPALVHHYFGTKSDLFLAAAAVPVDPRALLGAVFADGTSGAGERLLSTMLGVWDRAEMQDRMVALVRSGLGGDPAGEQLLRDAVSQIILATVREHLPPDEADLRVVLVGSQLVGLIVTRYVLRLPPMATLPRERVVELVAPNVQRYLDGELD